MFEPGRWKCREWASEIETRHCGAKAGKMSKMRLESFKINIWARDWKILRISLQINKFQYQNIRSRAQEFPKISFKNLKICLGQAEGRDKPKINIAKFKIDIFEPGLGNAKNELRDRPSEMSKWALETSKIIFSSHQGLGKNRKIISRMFHARFRKCRNGQESLKMLEKCRFWHMLEEPGAEAATKLSACQSLALQKVY